MEGEDYRRKIYDSYLSGRAGEPATEAALAARAPYLRRLVALHFPSDRAARVLDLGCGHGALLRFAREAGYADCRGVDASPQQVDAARRLAIAGVTLGDLRAALDAEADASLDAVVCFDVIEHFTKDELLDFAAAVARKLKTDGRWLVHAPNGASPFFGAVRWGDYTHEQAFTRESLAQLAAASGFRSVECFEDRPVVHGPVSAARAALWPFVRAAWRLCGAVETGDPGRGAILSRNLLAVARK